MSKKAPHTWMSSSLELKSDTSTFSPSETLVRDTHSLPEARMCASLGRSRFRPVFNTLTRLKDGWRGPRFLFLASLATSITSSQHLAVDREEGAALVKDCAFLKLIYSSSGWVKDKPPKLTGATLTPGIRSQRPAVTCTFMPKSPSDMSQSHTLVHISSTYIWSRAGHE